MNINEQTYNWNGTLTNRKTTKYLILHHRAGNGDVQSIHKIHLSNGWTGIGYHFYVRKDGTVYRGRPINTVGAHCTGYNDKSVGICFEGDFGREKMTDKQMQVGRKLITYLKGLYLSAEVKKHSDFNATACPGKNFPFEKIITIKRKELTTANDIVWELMHGKLKVEINDVDRAVKTLERAKAEDSSLYWILRKLVNG